MSAKFTPGPWRWEINLNGKSLHLVGGRPQFDLTLMDFERWGMGGATVRFRDLAHDGMNLMHKLHERPDWIHSFEGRKHHAHWCADVIHPDARLIAAAPDLYEACKTFAAWLDREERGFDLMTHDRSTSEGEAAWREWYDTNIALCSMAQELARAALAKAEGKS